MEEFNSARFNKTDFAEVSSDSKLTAQSTRHRAKDSFCAHFRSEAECLDAAFLEDTEAFRSG